MGIPNFKMRQAFGMFGASSSLIVFSLNIFVLAASSLHRPQASSLSSERIYGGTDADPGEFPHLVMITRGGCGGGSFMCTGSLVSNKAVVTAGHCCDGLSPSLVGVVVGNYKMGEDDPDEECIGVERVILNENYDSWTISNDICVLNLESEATLGPNVGTIPLPKSGEEYEEGTECQVAGWGDTGNGGMASVTQKANMTVVSDAICRESYGQSEIADSMICVEGASGTGLPDLCQGDSGDPLMCGNQLSGFMSWGYGCADPSFPPVFTQASYYVDWINDHM